MSFKELELPERETGSGMWYVCCLDKRDGWLKNDGDGCTDVVEPSNRLYFDTELKALIASESHYFKANKTFPYWAELKVSVSNMTREFYEEPNEPVGCQVMDFI